MDIWIKDQVRYLTLVEIHAKMLLLWGIFYDHWNLRFYWQW
jgi:hypothetical protein